LMSAPADTCNVTLRVHPCHEAALVAAFGVEPAERHDLAHRSRPLAVFVFEDVEPDPALRELARQGLTFDGSHDDGATYPGRRFVAHRGELGTADEPFGVVSVPVDPRTLALDELALQRLRAYQHLKRSVDLDLDQERPIGLALS